MEQSYLRDDRERWRRPERQDKDKETDVVIKQEKKDDQDETEEKKDNDEETEKQADVEAKKESNNVDNENTILDYKEGDDLSNVTPDMLPVYSTDRGVGRSFLAEFRCVQCHLCHKLLDNDETAEVHLRTWRHHQLFLRLLTKSNTQTQQPEVGKRPTSSEESGNWKRRKMSGDGNVTEEEHCNEQSEHEQQNGDEQTEAPQEEIAAATAEVKTEAVDDMDPVDDELDGWEQSIDDILNDENITNNEENEKVAEVTSEEKVEETPNEEEVDQNKANEEKPIENPDQTAAPAVDNSPKWKPQRGRGRGRRRY